MCCYQIMSIIKSLNNAIGSNKCEYCSQDPENNQPFKFYTFYIYAKQSLIWNITDHNIAESEGNLMRTEFQENQSVICWLLGLKIDIYVQQTQEGKFLSEERKIVFTLFLKWSSSANLTFMFLQMSEWRNRT